MILLKINELISKLKEYNPEADISLTSSEDITLGYIFKSLDGEVYTKETTKQVFIEPTDSCPVCEFEYIENGIRMCSFYEKTCKSVKECFAFEESDI